MPVPKEILAVKRPKNTIVVCYGKNKDRYAVRKRIGCKNVNGRHIPVNGPTIGHIVDGQYVPIEEIYPDYTAESSFIEMKDWADIVLCDNLFGGIRDELLAVFREEDALKIYCITVLRVCRPGIRDDELQNAYEHSFLSELYKDVDLSEPAVSKFRKDLGRKGSKIQTFMKNRIAAAGQNVDLLIDGTVQSGGSNDDPLAAFTRKAESGETGDVSVLYAYDPEKMEPVCSECFPGNGVDAAACGAFISDNGITKGIIVADPDFPFSEVSGLFRTHPDLHYLRPVRENARLIRTYDLLEFTGTLDGDKEILYRVEKRNGRRIWYYSFRDCKKAAAEERALQRSASEKGSSSFDEQEKRRPFFGTLVLESDMDLPAELMYRIYSSRREIGLVMRTYDSACAFVEDGKQNDPSMAGSGFCDFLSAVLTCRLISAFDREHLLDEMTFRQVMSILQQAKKVRGNSPEWQLVRTSAEHEEILRALGVLPALDSLPKRGRGRPRKIPTWI